MQVEELIKKLAHEDSDVRNSAVQALGHTRSSKQYLL